MKRSKISSSNGSISNATEKVLKSKQLYMFLLSFPCVHIQYFEHDSKENCFNSYNSTKCQPSHYICTELDIEWNGMCCAIFYNWKQAKWLTKNGMYKNEVIVWCASCGQCCMTVLILMTLFNNETN